jgi:hypothetical protein
MNISNLSLSQSHEYHPAESQWGRWKQSNCFVDFVAEEQTTLQSK